ncbi:MAG: hypothetical protein ABL874_12165, partial [Sphingopyxis sp.]
AMGRGVFVAGGRAVKANAAASTAAAPVDEADACATFFAHASPAVYARLILKRAGIVPLAIGIAAVTMASTASGQQAGGARVIALAQARVVIIADSARVGPDAEQSRAAPAADRALTAPPADVAVSVGPCDTSQQNAAARDATRLCQLWITNLP